MAVCIIVTVILSYIIGKTGAIGLISALTFIVALINLVVIFERHKNNLRFIFFVYAIVNILFALGILFAVEHYTHISISLDTLAIASAVGLVYLATITIFTLAGGVLKLLYDLIGKLGTLVVLTSIIIACYFPVYAAILVRNISGLEETLLISTTISLLGLPIFDRLHKNNNKLITQLLLTTMSFLLSLVLIIFYGSLIQTHTITVPIALNLNPFNATINGSTAPLGLNISALISSLIIAAFISGTYTIILVLRKMVFILKDSSKADSLNKLEVTEEHFKDLESCITKLSNNMNQRLSYVYFDPIYPLPKPDDLRGLMSSNVHWWDNLEDTVFGGVSKDILEDASYHFSKDLKKTADEFTIKLYRFIPRRYDAYSKLYDKMAKKYDILLSKILFANIIEDDYRIKYNLDVIRQTKGLEIKYKRALKSLYKIKEIGDYKATQTEFDDLVAVKNEIEKLINANH